TVEPPHGRFSGKTLHFSHSTPCRGKGYHRAAKPSAGEDLDIAEPVACWHAPAFHLHPTLASRQGAALIRPQVVQERRAGAKRLLAAIEVMEAFHGEHFVRVPDAWW